MWTVTIRLELGGERHESVGTSDDSLGVAFIRSCQYRNLERTDVLLEVCCGVVHEDGRELGFDDGECDLVRAVVDVIKRLGFDKTIRGQMALEDASLLLNADDEE